MSDTANPPGSLMLCPRCGYQHPVSAPCVGDTAKHERAFDRFQAGDPADHPENSPTPSRAAAREARMGEAGADFGRWAMQNSEATMEGNATLCLVEVIRQGILEVCASIEEAGREVEVPGSLVDVVVPIEADALDEWARVLERTGGNPVGADMLHTLAQIKRAERD